MLKPTIGNKAIDKHLTTDTPVATEENTQAEQPATTVQENTQEETTQQQESAETEQQTNAE